MAEAIAEMRIPPVLRLREMVPAVRSIERLKEGVKSLRERGVSSFSDFRQELELWARGEKRNDPSLNEVASQIQDLVGFQLKEGKNLTVWDLPKITLDAVDVLSVDAGPEEKQRLELAKEQVAEFEASGVLGNLGDDPEEALKQIAEVIVGQEGAALVDTVTEVVAASGEPYPKPSPPTLPTGEKGFLGGGKGPGFKYYGVMIGSIALMFCCAAQAAWPTVYDYLKIAPIRGEDAARDEWLKTASRVANDVVENRYPYSNIVAREQKGELGRERARDILDATARRIANDLNSEERLNNIKDPMWIARLIHDYAGMNEELEKQLFDVETIRDDKKKSEVIQIIQSGIFETYDYQEKEGYQPPPAVEAKFQRERARSTALRPPTRLQQAASTRVSTLQQRGGRKV